MKTSWWSALAIVGVAAGVWFYAERSRPQEDAMLRALAEKRVILEREIRRASGALTLRDREAANRARPLVNAAPVEAPAAPSRAAPAATKSQGELIAADPRLQNLHLVGRKALIKMEYGPFFRRRGLTPEQSARFTQAQLDYLERNMDLASIARTQDAAGKQSVARLQNEAREALAAAQAELLGPDGARELQEYSRSLAVRNTVVGGLAGAAALEGVPLTAEQGDRLWAAGLRAAGGDAQASGEALVRKIDWALFDQEARQILTPPQFAVMKGIAAPSEFGVPGRYQLQALVGQALQEDTPAASSGLRPPQSKPGGG